MHFRSPYENTKVELCGHLQILFEFRENSVDPAIPVWGIISAIVASVIERYEFGVIDDNVLIVIASSIVIILGIVAGPII